jgi:hypothetical protein
LIEFLLDMLRDEGTQADFARDPSATLAARGLAGVTAQDVRDVQPMLADVGGVQRVGAEAAHAAHHAGPRPPVHVPVHEPAHVPLHEVVREIHHVTHEYAVARPVTHVTQEYKTYTSYTEFTTDNSVHADGGSTVVQNSYNQDNDGVDNKGGTIDGSTVSGHDTDHSGNDVATTTVEGSGNDSHAVTETGSENVEATQEWHDVGAGPEPADDPQDGEGHLSHDPVPDDAPSHSFADGTVNDSYAVHAPAAASASTAEPVDALHHL